MKRETKSVARRVACPNGIPIRKKSLEFMIFSFVQCLCHNTSNQ
jgi:hypothetical protein